MQPNGRMPSAAQPTNPASVAGPARPVGPAAASEPTFDNGPSVVGEKGGGKAGWILGLVFLVLLAAGGIGFGVWAMMDGNTQKDNLNSQISSLKQQNSELQDRVTELESTIEDYEDTNNNNNNTADDVENESDDSVKWGSSKAEVIDGVFYVKDDNGEVLAQSDVTDIVEVVSCDYFEDASVLKCAVTASDGDGWFLYNFVDEELSSSFDS